MPTPNWRYKAVNRAVKAEEVVADGLDGELYSYLVAESPAPCVVGDALDIYDHPEHRAVLEAFILAGATPQLIERVLEVRVPVTDAYRHLFFDTSVFRNRLETLGYASGFDGSPHGREALRAAVTVGLDYLLWVYGKSDVSVDARQVIRHTMAEAYYRGLAHRGNSLTSGVTKEAHRWWTTAVRNAELLERIDPQAEKQAFDELRIQLEKSDDTYSTEDSPVDVTEIMH